MRAPARARGQSQYVLADFLADASAVQLLPLALRAVPRGVEEAVDVALLLILLLARQAQAVLGVAQSFLQTRGIYKFRMSVNVQVRGRSAN